MVWTRKVSLSWSMTTLTSAQRMAFASLPPTHGLACLEGKQILPNDLRRLPREGRGFVAMRGRILVSLQRAGRPKGRIVRRLGHGGFVPPARPSAPRRQEEPPAVFRTLACRAAPSPRARSCELGFARVPRYEGGWPCQVSILPSGFELCSVHGWPVTSGAALARFPQPCICGRHGRGVLAAAE